jgi:hypothetical protein
MRRILLRPSAALQLTLLALLSAGCSDPPEVVDRPLSNDQFKLGDGLNTFIEEYIEIDQLNPPGYGDANLLVGPDVAPGDGSASAQYPGSGTFIDWDFFKDDLENHVVPDAYPGKDPTAFPRKDECVGNAQVLSKMDLTYIAAANNKELAYFGVQRSDNNGDAAYYWIFTQVAPPFEEDLDACNAGERRLMFQITKGDVMIAGHFKPSAEEPLITVYKAGADLPDPITPMAALDFNSGIWGEESGAVVAAAVNTTDANPAGLGADGVKAVTGQGAIEKEIFAEAAVLTEVFTGGSICGASFFGTVITRSSGSGGTTPDLKDATEPTKFIFGDVTANAVLTPSCDPEVGYSATLTGFDNQPVTNATCKWTFNDTVIDGPCSGVTDPGTGCSDTVTPAAVTVYPPLAVTAALGGDCNNKLTYAAPTVTGGSKTNPDDYTYSWDFGGTPPDSSSRSGEYTGVAPGSYTGWVTVTDVRDGLTCEAKDDDSANVYSPVAVDITPSAMGASCTSEPPISGDAITYNAVASGGNGGPYSYAWTIDQAGYSCGDSAACLIGPPNDAFCATVKLYVTVSDGVCPAQNSEEETYTKTTTIGSSNLP